MHSIHSKFLNMLTGLNTLESSDSVKQSLIEFLNHEYPETRFQWSSIEPEESSKGVHIQTEYTDWGYITSTLPIRDAIKDPEEWDAFQKALKIIGNKLENCKLKEELNEYRLLANQSLDMLYEADLSENQRFLYVSPAIEKIFGYTQEEAKRLTARDLTEPTSFEFQKQRIGHYLQKTGQEKDSEELSEILELQLTRKDGSRFWGELNASLIKDENGKLIKSIGILRDISERKAFEKHLIESEEKFRTIFNNSYDAIFILDLQGHFLEVNTITVKKLGYSREEILQMDPWELDIPASKELILERINLVIQKGYYLFEGTHKTKSGKVYPVEMNAKLINFMGEKAIMVVSRDISERKRKEKALKQQEKKYRSLFKKAPVGIFTYDKKGNILDANEKLIEILGSPSIHATKQINVFQFESLVQNKISQDLKECIIQGKSVSNVRSYKTKWGKEIYLRYHLTPIYSEQGTPEMGQVILEDFTQQKEAEEALQDSEERFRLLFESANDAIFIMQGDRFIDCNSKTLEIFGCTREQIIEGKPYEMSPEYQPDGSTSKQKASERISQAIQGTPQSFQWKHLKCDGTPFDAEVSLNRIEVKGEVYVQAIVRDITEQIKAKEELIKQKERAEQNEAKSRGLLSAMPDMMFVFDREGIIRDYHAHTNEQLYAPSELFLNKSVDEILPPPIAQLTHEKTAQVLQTGIIQEYEYELEIQGERHIFESRMVLLNPDQTLAIVRDVTQNKKAESELKRREAILHSVIRNLPFDFWARDLNEVCFLQNERSHKDWKSLIGNKPEEQGIPEETLKLWKKNNQRAYKGETINEEVEYTNKFGEKSYFQNIIAPIKEDERIIGIMGLNIDISQRKEYENALIKAKEKAEESDQLKSAFLANMSHEIRTPMNGILGFTQLLRSRDLSREEQLQFLEIIHQKSNHLLDIINDIIDISKIEANQLQLNPTVFSVNGLLMELHKEVQLELEESDEQNINLVVEEKYLRGDIQIHSDKFRIRQVLHNLLNNAIKFTEKGSIEMGFRKEDSSILFFVKDEGIGIPEEKKDTIFNRFRQAEEFTTRKYGGTGLGLSISKSLVELMGGKIWVESTPGKGSAFFFTIPYEQLEFINKPGQKDENSVDITPQNYTWNSETFLIVEDDPASLNLLKTVLTKTGANILTAETGQQALEQFRQNSHLLPVVLMDIQLPDINGLEITRKIKQIDPKSLVIAQTAYAMNGDQSKSLEAGCDDYIPKPIDFADLLKKISQLLNRKET